MRVFLLITLLALTASCSTVSPYCTLPKTEEIEGAKLVIYREKALPGALYSTPMSINRCSIGNLSNDSYKVYVLPSGHHRIAAEKRMFEAGGGDILEITTEPGSVYYVRLKMGVFGLEPLTQLSLVEKSVALSQQPKLKSLK